MKYNSHILLKAISDPVNSYTRIELHNVPNPPNSEIALPIHIKRTNDFSIHFSISHTNFSFIFLPLCTFLLYIIYLKTHLILSLTIVLLSFLIHISHHVYPLTSLHVTISNGGVQSIYQVAIFL